ncbi:MAG: SDR family oxidoreductase [Porphyrobacter sp.]|nr:SDR family oxidoreductase [Porphyrobacter sp.]
MAGRGGRRCAARGPRPGAGRVARGRCAWAGSNAAGRGWRAPPSAARSRSPPRSTRRLAANGAKVALGARRADRLAALAAEIGESAAAVQMDVAREADIIAGFDAAEAAFGSPIDPVIANAGVDGAGMITAMSEAEIAHTLQVNLTGAILTAREGARRMMAAGVIRGRILLVASITAFEPSPGLVAYSASKAGVVQAGRTLAREWARTGINVNTVSPGYIRTAINDAWFDTEGGQKQIARFPKRRLMGEDGLDAMILFLCSDASEFVTGTDFVLDDGQTL